MCVYLARDKMPKKKNITKLHNIFHLYLLYDEAFFS